MTFLVHHDKEAQKLRLRWEVVEGRPVVKLPQNRRKPCNCEFGYFLQENYSSLTLLQDASFGKVHASHL